MPRPAARAPETHASNSLPYFSWGFTGTRTHARAAPVPVVTLPPQQTRLRSHSPHTRHGACLTHYLTIGCVSYTLTHHRLRVSRGACGSCSLRLWPLHLHPHKASMVKTSLSNMRPSSDVNYVELSSALQRQTRGQKGAWILQSAKITTPCRQ